MCTCCTSETGRTARGQLFVVIVLSVVRFVIKYRHRLGSNCSQRHHSHPRTIPRPCRCGLESYFEQHRSAPRTAANIHACAITACDTSHKCAHACDATNKMKYKRRRADLPNCAGTSIMSPAEAAHWPYMLQPHSNNVPSRLTAAECPTPQDTLATGVPAPTCELKQNHGQRNVYLPQSSATSWGSLIMAPRP